jgi:hypothetical protein
MTTRKSKDYKITAVNYYLVEDNTQEEVCNIFKGAYERPEKYVAKNKTRKIKKNYL